MHPVNLSEATTQGLSRQKWRMRLMRFMRHRYALIRSQASQGKGVKIPVLDRDFVGVFC